MNVFIECIHAVVVVVVVVVLGKLMLHGERRRNDFTAFSLLLSFSPSLLFVDT
jgi:hypothetical protein